MDVMGNALTVALRLKAYDEMSKVVGEASAKSIRDLTKLSEKMRAISEQLAHFGVGAMAGGFAAAAVMAGPIKAFADLEEAQTRLEVAGMRANGTLAEGMEELNALAKKLGTSYPGTTKEFADAFFTLQTRGIDVQNILGGVGQATADLGVVTRINFTDAANVVATFQKATGVAAKDMVALVDTVQRAQFVGVNPTELAEGVSRSVGALKSFKIQGIDAAKELVTTYAILKQSVPTLERLGTNMNEVLTRLADAKELKKGNAELARFGIHLELFDRHTGQFRGFRELFRQFGELQRLNPVQAVEATKAFARGAFGAAEIGSFVAEGAAGYDKMAKRLEEQANLQQRVQRILGDLTNVWKAAYTTVITATAAFGRAVAPELKFTIDRLNDLGAALDGFLERHQILAKVVGLGILSFAGLAIGAGALALGLAGVLKYLSLVTGSAATVHLWLSRLAVVSAAERLRYLGIVPQAEGLWAGLGQRIGVTWGKLTQWTAAMWASANATIFNLGWLKAQATLYGGMLWSSIVDVSKVTGKFVSAQWDLAKATYLNLEWLTKQAKLLTGTLWSGAVDATKALWGLVAAQWANVTAAAAAAGGWWALTTAMLANPIVWVGAAIAAVALLIYKYWGPLVGFFRGLFTGIAEGWNEIAERSIVLRTIGTVVWAILTPLRWLYNLIMWIVTPIEDVGQAWEHTGARIGRVIGQWIATITNLPGQAVTAMFHAGANLVEALWRGLKSRTPKAITAMWDLVKSISNLLPHTGPAADAAGHPDLVKSISNLLPHSPAKEGPLATLHQVRIVETIAETIRPAALVGRLTQTLQAARDAIRPQMLIQRVSATLQAAISPQRPALSAPGFGALAGGMGPMAFTFNLTINGAETSGAGGTKALAQRVAKETSLEFEKVMRRKYAI
jgi:TP901 family phage tail tape measure protein